MIVSCVNLFFAPSFVFCGVIYAILENKCTVRKKNVPI